MHFIINWILEGAGFLGAAMFGVSRVSQPPYCETCGAWCKAVGEICTFQPGHSTEIKKALENKDFAVLEQIGRAPSNGRFWNRLDLQVCAGCGDRMPELMRVGFTHHPGFGGKLHILPVIAQKLYQHRFEAVFVEVQFQRPWALLILMRSSGEMDRRLPVYL